MYNAKAFSAASATSPLATTTIQRRDPTENDVQIEVLFCGICHSDLHQVRNEWSEVFPTVYPLVPGHEIVGRVLTTGSAVTRFEPGDIAAVGCMVDSDGTCPACKEGLEQFCPNFTLTYNFPDKLSGGVTYGGYSESIVVNQKFVLKVPSNLDLAAAAPLLCAGITTYSPMHHWGVTRGQKVGIVGLGGLGHMGVKFAHALGAHTVLFTTSPNKKKTPCVWARTKSSSPVTPRKWPSTLSVLISSSMPSLPSTTSMLISTCFAATGICASWAHPKNRCRSLHSISSSAAAASPGRPSEASQKPSRCSTSAALTTSPPMSRSSLSRR